MISHLHLESFKCFSSYDVEFKQIQLLIGGNNSGKTTIFQALQVFFWCLDQTADVTDATVNLRKTQLPEVGAIPYFTVRDLFHKQRIRSAGSPTRIVVQIRTTVAPEITFKIYPAFSRNIMVDGGGTTITRAQYNSLKLLSPILIPSTIGIVPREELFRPIAQERMISEGRHNLILRNLIYRLSKTDHWEDFTKLIQPLFGIAGISVPFDEEKDEWLTSLYRDSDGEFDFISAGSGFLQVANIIAFLFLNPTKVALLDEPDSHMHDDLQRLIFDILKEVSEKRGLQIIVSTHSPTLIDAAGYESLLLIDRSETKPLQPEDTETLIPRLSDMGLSLPPRKLMDTLRGRKVLFVEGEEADYENFLKVLGRKVFTDFSEVTRMLTVFQTEGPTMNWPFDTIKAFEKLIGTRIRYVYISDADLNTDEQLREREKKATEQGHTIRHLSRRNRESYMLDPIILSRLLEKKWKVKNATVDTPELLTEQGIKTFLLENATTDEDRVRTSLFVYQEPSLRGDAQHKTALTQELNDFFRVNYVAPLQSKEIPFRLLDSKTLLRTFRTEAQAHGLSFSDREILDEYTQDEIPQDIKNIVTDIRSMFQENKVSGADAEPQTKKAIKSVNKPLSQRKTRKKRRVRIKKRKPKRA
jgi:hypothetical protein